MNLTLFKEIGEVFKPRKVEHVQTLLKQSTTLTVADLRARLQAHLREKRKGYNPELVRVKIVVSADENPDR